VLKRADRHEPAGAEVTLRVMIDMLFPTPSARNRLLPLLALRFSYRPRRTELSRCIQPYLTLRLLLKSLNRNRLHTTCCRCISDGSLPFSNWAVQCRRGQLTHTVDEIEQRQRGSTVCGIRSGVTYIKAVLERDKSIRVFTAIFPNPGGRLHWLDPMLRV
jgi:hypothetical protein